MAMDITLAVNTHGSNGYQGHGPEKNLQQGGHDA